MTDFLRYPDLQPPANDVRMRAEISALASTGFSKQGCAQHFGVSLGTFNRWLEENPLLAEAFSQGRERERQSLHNVLYTLAVEGRDKIAAMFLLKARHGYKEGDQQDQTNRVNITFNLPGAMTADQYRTIEGVATPKPKRSDEYGD